MIKFKNTICLFIVVYASISLAGCTNDKKLPIYGQREAKVTKDGVDTLYQTIPSFAFLNQDSVVTTQEVLKDKVYIADFFFTSCSTICPIMHRNLKEVFDQYKDNPDVMFLSHTIDFKYDKPSVLKKYAQKLGVDGKKWQFVWGNKDEIYTIAEKSYLTVVEEDSTATDGYIHQGWLVLIDKEKRIRGAYDGTKTEQVAQLKKDVEILLAEYKK
ncbi:SCO family protein [Pedobacter sp. Du54]|uniref:SCO family protein n=1 Tax=Pedobacter anseongensis TaxID=3133439 RepID=UPI0030A2E738